VTTGGPADLDPYDPLVSVSYAGWWARSVELAKRTWAQTLLLQVAVVAVNLLVILPVTLLQHWLFFGGGTLNLSGAMKSLPITLASGIVLTALRLVVFAVVGLAGVHLVTAVAVGRPVSAVTAMRQAMFRVWPMIGWSLLFGLLVGLGYAACVLPAFYLALLFILLAPVIAYERGNPFDRTFTLANSAFSGPLGVLATILGVYVGGFVVQLAIAQVMSLVMTAALGATGEYVNVVLAAVVSCVIWAGVAVFAYPTQVTAYALLRARREALSTGQLAAELAT
jgi:hypothetical protein